MMKVFIAAMLVIGACITMSCAQSMGNSTVESLGLPTDTQIRGVRYPNYDDEGNLTSQVFGEYANFMEGGNIEIHGLRIELYEYEDGNRITKLTVTSSECFYNMKRGQIVGEKDIRIARDDFVVTGTGFTFNEKAQELKILSDAKVVAQTAGKALKDFD